MKTKIKKLRENAKIPVYQTPISAAADLYACLDAPLTVCAGERAKIPTGIAIEYEDEDVVAVICARSGLSAKHGIDEEKAITAAKNIQRIFTAFLFIDKSPEFKKIYQTSLTNALHSLMNHRKEHSLCDPQSVLILPHSFR